MASHAVRSYALALALALALTLAVAGLPNASVRAADLVELPVENVADATLAIREALRSSGVAPTGTMSANVTLDETGRPRVGEMFGSLQREEAVRALVRSGTAALKLTIPDGWAAAHPTRQWVVFWSFQNKGCKERLYDVPADATLVRVCLDVDDGGSLREPPSIRFEPYTRGHRVEMVRPQPGDPCPYPIASRRLGEQGAGAFLVRIDAEGRATALRMVESSGFPRLDEATRSCVTNLRYLPFGGVEAEDGIGWVRWTWRLSN